ncbi:MAG: Cytochrome c family protein [Labilithrix sp.]|nr:Cytochrome c family protein [Labilithrix sp.]
MRRLLRLVLLALPLLLAACAGILGIRPKTGPALFEHRSHVLNGVSCLDCHSGIMAAGEEGPLHLPTDATCRKCHQKPHDEHSCTGCHGTPHERASAENARVTLRFEHRKHMSAANGQCIRCHVKIGDPSPDTLLAPMATCFGCHQHEDQFAMRTCDGCHVDLPGERIKPDSHIVHEGDFIREHGVRAASSRDLCATCHAERFCSSCHGVTTPGLPARLAFDDPRLSGLHRAGFKSRHALESRAQPGLCTTCHSEASCSECHARENVGAKNVRGSSGPHPRGWIGGGRGGGHGNAARLDPLSCAGCHGGAGEQLCVGCHKVGGPGGSPHGAGFVSQKDKRRDVPCRQCHALGS